MSTLDQHTERQLDGIEVNKTFTDKASDKDTKRPQLELLMSFVRKPDAGNPHVRFDERVLETGHGRDTVAPPGNQADNGENKRRPKLPRQYSTLPFQRITW